VFINGCAIKDIMAIAQTALLPCGHMGCVVDLIVNLRFVTHVPIIEFLIEAGDEKFMGEMRASLSQRG
jgi:hypothetical protein